MSAAGFRSPAYAYSPVLGPASAATGFTPTQTLNQAEGHVTGEAGARGRAQTAANQHGSSSIVGQMLHARPRELVSHAHAHGSGVTELHRQWRLSLEYGAAAVPLSFLREVARDSRQVSADAGEAKLLGETPLYEFVCDRCDSLTKRIEELARRTSVTGMNNAVKVHSKELMHLASTLKRSVAVVTDMADKEVSNVTIHMGSSKHVAVANKDSENINRWNMAARWAEACAWCMYLNIYGFRWRFPPSTDVTSSEGMYLNEMSSEESLVDSLLISRWMTADVKSKWPMLTVAVALEVLLYGVHDGDGVDTDGPMTDSAHVVLLYYLRGAGAPIDALQSVASVLGINDSTMELASLCFTLDTNNPSKIRWQTVVASIQQKLTSDRESLQIRGHEELAALVNSLIARNHGETALAVMRTVEQSLCLRETLSYQINDANLRSLQSCIAARLACDMVEDAMSFTIEVGQRCDRSSKAACAASMISQIADHCLSSTDGFGRLVRVPFGPMEEVALRQWLNNKAGDVNDKSFEIMRNKILGMYCLLRGRYCEANHLGETNSELDKLIHVTSSLLPEVQRTMEVVDNSDRFSGGPSDAGQIKVSNQPNGQTFIQSRCLLDLPRAKQTAYLSPFVTPFPRSLLESEVLSDYKVTGKSDVNNAHLVRQSEESQLGSGASLGGVLGGIAQKNRKQNQHVKKRKANAFI